MLVDLQRDLMHTEHVCFLSIYKEISLGTYKPTNLTPEDKWIYFWYNFLIGSMQWKILSAKPNIQKKFFLKCLPNQRRQNNCGSQIKTIIFKDSSRIPRAYSCIRSINDCPLNATGASPSHQMCVVLVVKSQQGGYDITDKWHTYTPFELRSWRRLLRAPWTARR